MATTAAMLLEKDHARHLAAALPGRFTGRMVDVGEDRGVRVSHRDAGKVTGFWEAVAVTSTTTWVWWIPGQDVRCSHSSGTLMASVDAPLHFPEEWADRVAAAIEDAKEKREGAWTMPI